jgi:hypothetical protein
MRTRLTFYLAGIYCIATPLLLKMRYGDNLESITTTTMLLWVGIGIGLLLRSVPAVGVAVLALPLGYLVDLVMGLGDWKLAEGNTAYFLTPPMSLVPMLAGSKYFFNTLEGNHLLRFIYYYAHLLVLVPSAWVSRFKVAYICALILLAPAFAIYEDGLASRQLTPADQVAM